MNAFLSSLRKKFARFIGTNYFLEIMLSSAPNIAIFNTHPEIGPTQKWPQYSSAAYIPEFFRNVIYR